MTKRSIAPIAKANLMARELAQFIANEVCPLYHPPTTASRQLNEESWKFVNLINTLQMEEEGIAAGTQLDGFRRTTINADGWGIWKNDKGVTLMVDHEGSVYQYMPIPSLDIYGDEWNQKWRG